MDTADPHAARACRQCERRLVPGDTAVVAAQQYAQPRVLRVAPADVDATCITTGHLDRLGLEVVGQGRQQLPAARVVSRLRHQVLVAAKTCITDFAQGRGDHQHTLAIAGVQRQIGSARRGQRRARTRPVAASVATHEGAARRRQQNQAATLAQRERRIGDHAARGHRC